MLLTLDVVQKIKKININMIRFMSAQVCNNAGIRQRQMMKQIKDILTPNAQANMSRVPNGCTHKNLIQQKELFIKAAFLQDTVVLVIEKMT